MNGHTLNYLTKSFIDLEQPCKGRRHYFFFLMEQEGFDPPTGTLLKFRVQITET